MFRIIAANNTNPKCLIITLLGRKKIKKIIKSGWFFMSANKMDGFAQRVIQSNLKAGLQNKQKPTEICHHHHSPRHTDPKNCISYKDTKIRLSNVMEQASI